MEHTLAGPEVQLHPQLLRNPLPSSHHLAQVEDDEDAAMPPPSPLATSPFFPGLDTILPSSSTTTLPRMSSRRPSPAASPSPTSTPTSSSKTAPAHGLTSLDARAFPLYSTTPGTPELRVLSAHEFAHLHEQHCRVKLPETELFPWAHGGADVPYSAAAHYFGFRRGHAAKPPSYRGLTVIHAPPMPVEPTPGSTSRSLLRRGLASSTDSWSSATSSNTTSSSSSPSLTQSTSSSRSSISSSSGPSARLVSSFDASTILSTSRTTGETRFALPNPRSFENVNLRHFRLQAVKYATVSDIVVYGENGIDQSVVMTACKAKEAIDAEYRRHGMEGVEYNVYMIADPFTEFERHYPRLVSIDSHGFSRNRLNFFEREREEMRVLTAATEIGPNVWLGNTQDVPTPKAHQRTLGAEDGSSINMDDGNPCSFSICIESHDQAQLLSRDILDSATQVLDELEHTGHRLCEEVQPVLTADNEVVETTRTLLRPNVDEIVHLEAVSTAAALGSSTRAQDVFVAQLVDLAVWIRDQSAPNPLLSAVHDSHSSSSSSSSSHAPRRVLLHCGDGYTETSLLALAYVMLSRRCAVSEAYLFLQLDCERSFFVYTADRETVLKIEQRVMEVLEREDEEERYTRRWLAEQRAVAAFGVQTASSMRRSSPARDLAAANNDFGDLNEGDNEEDQTVTLDMSTGGLSSSSMGRSDSGYVDSTELDGPLLLDDKTRCALEEEAARCEAEIEQACGGPKRRMRAADPVQDAWFFGPTFEGHFPSRILPHLYLGNVKHASNALMLKAIGITHVVSMGESALQPPKTPSGLSLLTSPFRSSSPSASDAAVPSNSLWEEERAGAIEVLDMQNVADDGIDSIRPCIDEALEFIRTARQQGGKVLVHCKVGVSRSASIVIAYLMREMGLDLASSYLLTRSRRLNILVQPNLPFIAALHAFEAELLEEKERALALSRPRAAVQGHSPSSSIGSVSEYGDCIDEEEERDSLHVLGQPGLKRSNRLGFSFLCGEIARLNERFLC
ncbi:hypothetical protein JCM10908_005669 [Rhodotorula pacifica]|uniref:tyrosine/serine/threonine protein phosphatase PPS1 n=1 Tax=Rhodotorula pacifica TaxID=1495444 RepID=UPI0031766BF1